MSSRRRADRRRAATRCGCLARRTNGWWQCRRCSCCRACSRRSGRRPARGTRWRFHLRGGITNHDGSPLEPWQVAASLRASAPSWKVAAEGDTIAVDTDAPVADLPWVMAEPRHAIVIRGTGRTLVGTGPFRVDRVEATRVSLRAHDAYWHARPFVDAIQIDMGRPIAGQLADVEAGRTDVIGVRPTDATRLTRRGV